MATIAEALTRVMKGQFTLALPLDVQAPNKYIIFSDQHKGGGDGADEFRDSKDTYVAALEYYRENKYSLILMGDVEELWEQGFKEVERTYRDVLLLEGSFPAGRYFRIWGNHDNEWMNERNVGKKLSKYMPTAAVYEAIRFEVVDDKEPVGTLLLSHGHQGTIDSDKLSWLGKFVLPIYRLFQRLTKFGKQTPAIDNCLRGLHDTEMYQWAASQKKLILIAGHTHRPVWSSRTHLQKLEQELKELKESPDSTEEQILKKQSEVDERREKYPPCEDDIKPKPAYFNSGCCKFEDGDITGIEIVDGTISLVKWSSNTFKKRELESEELVSLYSEL